MKLTRTQRRILEWLAHNIDDDHDGELVCSGGEAWTGLDRHSMQPVYALLRLMVLRDASTSDHSDIRRYTINSTGTYLLAGVVTVDELRRVIDARTPFTVTSRGLKVIR